MKKIICFFRQREHYKKRLKDRKGKHLLFLLAKKVKTRSSFDPSLQMNPCEEWKYKNFVWLTQGLKLQTFINKDL